MVRSEAGGDSVDAGYRQGESCGFGFLNCVIHVGTLHRALTRDLVPRLTPTSTLLYMYPIGPKNRKRQLVVIEIGEKSLYAIKSF